MRNFFNTIIMMLLFCNLVYCKKKDMVNPEQNIETCKNVDTTHFFIENNGNVSKTFRIYGGDTGLDTVDNNSNQIFSVGSGFNNAVLGIGKQINEKYIVVGLFTEYKGQSFNNIVRIDQYGDIDYTFNVGLGFNAGAFVRTVTIQPDGKIIIGGMFSSYNGTSSNNIIRLNSDGTVDNTFNIGTGFNSTVNTITIQSDNKILIGGNFTTYNGGSAIKIIRLNSNGLVDGSFSSGAGFTGSVGAVVNSIRLQADNKIVVGGLFEFYDGNQSDYVARLNSNGSFDNTFISFNPTATVSDLVIQSTGKIIIGGQFSTDTGGPGTPNHLARMNSDGSLDNTFQLGTGFNPTGNVRSLTVNTQDEITVVGSFTSYQGITANRIIKLNADGSIDNSFDAGTGFNGSVAVVFLNSQNNITVAGGSFTEYNGSNYNFIVALGESGESNYTPVSVIVNGNQSIFFVNMDSSFNPICICKLKIEGSSQQVLSNLMYKKEQNATGHIESETINLLSKYTANNSQFVVEIQGEELKSCVLDGSNYLEWIIPPQSTANIEITYNQYNRIDNLKTGNSNGQPTKKKRYIHAIIRD
jgi:uncharacterized delta-60 repeat protein